MGPWSLLLTYNPCSEAFSNPSSDQAPNIPCSISDKFKITNSIDSKVWYLNKQSLRASSHEPGANFTLGSYEKFQHGLRGEKGPKILGASSGTKFEKQSKHSKTKKYSFQASGVANGTSKNVGLGKFWQDLEISEAFLISLEVSFLHGLYLLFSSLETFTKESRAQISN